MEMRSIKYGDDMVHPPRNNLKYPILLVHGMGFRDNKMINYWGRILKGLEQIGCKIFYGYQDSNASIEINGQTIAYRINEIIEETGADKVNIIAHSRGGLDSRYAISTSHAGSKVASLTTISTPHNGSKTVKNPDDEDVYYQSYAFAMRNPFSDIFMWLPNLVVGIFEGQNDGLLTPEAVKWGDFKGVYYGVGNRGISHCDEVDMRRKQFSRKSGNGVSDIVNIYKKIVFELCKRGF